MEEESQMAIMSVIGGVYVLVVSVEGVYGGRANHREQV